MEKTGCILVNFGGPRSQEEIAPFLKELLCDRDVVRTNFFPFFHQWFFSRIAERRAKKIHEEYLSMGGGSPIFSTTEALKETLTKEWKIPILSFHRYIPSLHASFVHEVIESSKNIDKWRVIPLFPQFSFVTTGSCARFFGDHLPQNILNRMEWVQSYPNHALFIKAWETQIKKHLIEVKKEEKETLFLHTAHGVPIKCIESGDIYEKECQKTFFALSACFPESKHLLCYQSKFGKDPWLTPSTEDISKNIQKYTEGKSHVVFLPFTFTSDHIETLVEIEKQYIPLITDSGFSSSRVPCFTQEETFCNTLLSLFKDSSSITTEMLIRKKGCKEKCSSCRTRCKY